MGRGLVFGVSFKSSLTTPKTNPHPSLRHTPFYCIEAGDWGFNAIARVTPSLMGALPRLPWVVHYDLVHSAHGYVGFCLVSWVEDSATA